MDNLCHTLAGAALGETGLKRRTRFGSVTLMLASNLPDLDVLVFATSVPAIAFRRGWTHGVLAQALLPAALALLMFVIARRRSGDAASPPRLSGLLLLSYIGVVLHVFMDFLNNYGVRLLFPFRREWFYGDTLFIIDPWLWLILGAGIWLARQRRSTRPAQWAVTVAGIYIVAMLTGARVARGIVANAWTAANGSEPRALMVGPMPLTPLERVVVLDAGDRYVTGTFTWLPPEVRFETQPVPKNERDPLVEQARLDPAISPFLIWSRFPFWTLEPLNGATRVSVGDMRFAPRPIPLLPARAGFTAATIVDEECCRGGP